MAPFSSLFSSAFQRKTKKKETEDDSSEKRKKQQQKLDFESSRKRGIVPGWKTEFPWLGTNENDKTMFCTVSLLQFQK